MAATRVVAQDTPALLKFTSACDGSAAEAISPTRFALANDEDNVLRLYSVDKPGKPVDEIDVTQFLALKEAKGEADIEAAARLGDRVFWVTSHGRSKKGKMQPDRHRFFSTLIAKSGRESYIAPAGTPYRDLARRLVEDPRYAALGLKEATQFEKLEAAELAPKEKGLNIEGMTANSKGSGLLLALRNPRPLKDGKPMALVVPFDNPREVTDRALDPKFGDPILLDLAGNGIRGIAWSAKLAAYYIIAGAPEGGGKFTLYRWTGKPAEAPTVATDFKGLPADFAPEGLTFLEGRTDALVLSDDGTVPVNVQSAAECLDGFADGKCPNKSLKDLEARTFRGTWVKL